MPNDIKFVAILGAVAIGVVLAFILPGTYTTYQRQQLMSQDIQIALQKGIDPLAVRCAYSRTQSEADSLCMLYTMHLKGYKVDVNR